MTHSPPSPDDATAPRQGRTPRAPPGDPEIRILVPPPPRRVPATLIAAGLVAVVVGMALTVLRPKASENPSPAPARPAAEASPTPTREEGRDTPSPGGIHAVLEVSIRSWAEVSVDGSLALQEMLEEGRRVELDARQELELMLGNAGGVRLEVNGEEIPTGEPGEVVRLWFEWEDGRLVRG